MPVIAEEVLEASRIKLDTDLYVFLRDKNYLAIDQILEIIISDLHLAIPDRKRVSYGITYVVKSLAKILYDWIENSEFKTLSIGIELYEHMLSFKTKSIGLGLISYAGLIDTANSLEYFEDAACHEIWEVREFAQMYIRKITKKHPDTVQKFLMGLAVSDDPNKRRFASESLRPVGENKWINDKPEFSLEVLRLLFTEEDPYPSTSVANNLSDLSRKQGELILNVVSELLSLENEKAYWIAYRACRTLINTEKVKVMNLLKVDTYTYKKKIYFRNEST